MNRDHKIHCTYPIHRFCFQRSKASVSVDAVRGFFFEGFKHDCVSRMKSTMLHVSTEGGGEKVALKARLRLRLSKIGAIG